MEVKAPGLLGHPFLTTTRNAVYRYSPYGDSTGPGPLLHTNGSTHYPSPQDEPALNYVNGALERSLKHM